MWIGYCSAEHTWHSVAKARAVRELRKVWGGTDEFEVEAQRYLDNNHFVGIDDIKRDELLKRPSVQKKLEKLREYRKTTPGACQRRPEMI